MWVIEAWSKQAKKWGPIGEHSSAERVEVVVKMGTEKGFVTRATHPNGQRMGAYPHGRGFYHYRPLEKDDESQAVE